MAETEDFDETSPLRFIKFMISHQKKFVILNTREK